MATIIIRNSTGSGVIPSSLQQGELAINTVDGRLFYGSGSGNAVVEFTFSSATASYLNPLHQDVIVTGSLFLTSTANNVFLITNQTNPVFTITQSGVIIASTQSTVPTGTYTNGAFYFTSSSLYVSLD
jgi:hypothetical protein